MSNYDIRNKSKSNGSSDPNKALLDEAEDIQRKTSEVAQRCQQQLNETEELGINTLDEIRNQNETINSIQNSTTLTNAKLDHTNQLLNRYDRWAFHWLGGNKRMARKEVKQATKEMKIIEKQQATIRQKKSVETKKPSGDYYGNNQEANRSKLLSSSTSTSTSTPSPRLRKVDTIPYDVDDNNNYSATPLNDETKEQLQHINDQDVEIDSMLDSMVESLDRLSQISKTVDTDIKQHNQQIDTVVRTVNNVNYKQSVAQSRLRRNLNK
jgi:hypothetical protein